MPLGSIMNVARTLWVPRDLPHSPREPLPRARFWQWTWVESVNASSSKQPVLAWTPHCSAISTAWKVGLRVWVCSARRCGFYASWAVPGDGGLLDVVVFRHTSIRRVLLHLALVAGARPVPPPAQARTFRVASVRVSKRHGRPLPVHADGTPTGVRPVEVHIAPAALRVIVGPPEESGIRA